MNNRVTVEEGKKMLGTEFIYEYDDGDTVRCYVKAFDPEIGLTCFTLESRTKMGWDAPGRQKEDDGSWCITAHDFSKAHTLEGALTDLTTIRDTGMISVIGKMGFGTPMCAF